MDCAQLLRWLLAADAFVRAARTNDGQASRSPINLSPIATGACARALVGDVIGANGLQWTRCPSRIWGANMRISSWSCWSRDRVEWSSKTGQTGRWAILDARSPKMLRPVPFSIPEAVIEG